MIATKKFKEMALCGRHPSKLFLEVTTRCNLQCKMCVRQAAGNGIVQGDLAMATFESLKPSFAHLDRVILGGIGEPLLHPQLERFIYEIKKELPAYGSVGLQTNGTLLTRERIERLVALDLDTYCISVDAVSADMLGSIRSGAQLEQLETALTRLVQIKLRAMCTAPQVGIEFVLMRDNLTHLPEVIRWAHRLGIDFVIVTHLLPFDAALSNQAAYPGSTDASIALFREWREKIDRLGLRIEDYPQASLKFYKHRNAEEQHIIRLVEDMKRSAYQSDIPLDLGKLIQPEAAWMAAVGPVFEEALALALEKGLDLALPALQPAVERACSFVEEGSIFVAWDGAVSPCHFTWHQYACYLDGRKKMVQPKFFGKPGPMTLADIWNGPDFKSFREDVLDYNYPYCGNCSFAPCDYIDDPVFIQDCYANPVPCCDCPWSTGLLNCLQ